MKESFRSDLLYPNSTWTPSCFTRFYSPDAVSRTTRRPELLKRESSEQMEIMFCCELVSCDRTLLKHWTQDTISTHSNRRQVLHTQRRSGRTRTNCPFPICKKLPPVLFALHRHRQRAIWSSSAASAASAITAASSAFKNSPHNTRNFWYDFLGYSYIQTYFIGFSSFLY